MERNGMQSTALPNEREIFVPFSSVGGEATTDGEKNGGEEANENTSKNVIVHDLYIKLDKNN
uniref:Uncharacterized protein n=1 Tax=Romanomermis culicivorax TaxID=13658 RepID=A0A915JD41_ROMCU